MLERLQKLIAEAGIASRRKAEELIAAGEVAVNGVVVRELGTKADPEHDHIRVGGKLINAQIVDRELIYVLLNKPRGYLSSTADPQNRPLATDLLPPNLRSKVHTVGRLDFNTEGLLILTNDGKLTHAVTRAGRVPKVYQVKVKGHPGEEQIARLRRGVPVDGRRTAPADIELLDATEADNAWFRVVLVQGRNQQIRKMFDTTNHSVVKLRRVQIGAITDAGLRVGAWRHLSEQEVAQLMAPKAPAPRAGAAATGARATGARAAKGRAKKAPVAPVGKPGGPTRRAEGVRAGGAKSRTAGAKKAAPRKRGGPKGKTG